MLSTDILLFNVRRIPIENLIDSAMDAGWKVIDEYRKVIFRKEGERVSLYFGDDDKSQFLRAYLGETTTEPMSDPSSSPTLTTDSA